MQIKINLTRNAQRKAEIAEREFDLVPERMILTVRQAAEALRDTDPYTDRTGNLRASTKEVVESVGDPTVVSLNMGESYASYVKNLGYSAFDEKVEETIETLKDGMTAMRRRIVGR